MSTNFIGANGSSYLWSDPSVWDNGVPTPGDIVTADASIAELTFGDLGLAGMSILTSGIVLSGNILSLSNTTFTTAPPSGGYPTSELTTNLLIVGHNSFVGVTPGTNTLATMTITGGQIDNYGTIADESGRGGSIVVQGNTSSGVLLDNRGTIAATNGGFTDLFQADVFGRGNIMLSSGGTLDLVASTLAATQMIHFGGDTASEMMFDPLASTVNAGIFGFTNTDLIDLQGVDAGSLTIQNSSSLGINPTLTFTGTDRGQAVTFALNLHGNYSSSSFSVATDSTGTGAVLYTDHA